MNCYFNRMVSCEHRAKCSGCGWIPEVSAARTAQLRARLEREKAEKEKVKRDAAWLMQEVVKC